MPKIFQINNPRWADYWQQQAYPVMLVIRRSDSEIRWMDVKAYLKQASASGQVVNQIVFKGEQLDVMSVRKWRESVCPRIYRDAFFHSLVLKIGLPFLLNPAGLRLS